MKVDKVYSIYYSATGTTQKIVSYIGENIAKKLNVEFEKYNFTLPKKREGVLEFKENDLVICGTPTYAGRIPNVMLPYYKNNIKANGALAIPVVLYGNRNFDDSLIELRNTMQENGFYTIAGAGFIGEHAFSYVLGAGRPDDKDMAIAAEFVDKVVEKIKNMTDIPKEPIKVRGNDPKILQNVLTVKLVLMYVLWLLLILMTLHNMLANVSNAVLVLRNVLSIADIMMMRVSYTISMT